jgi:hypothetical protein
MRDPLDELRKLTDVASRPLPAGEVRRRGDRMRRRRTLTQAVGAVAAVAVVVSGGAFMTGSLSSAPVPPGPAERTPSPTPSEAPPAPEGGWVTEIPDGFRLDDGLPEPGGENGDRERSDRLRTPWVFDPCHEQAPGESSRTDLTAVTQSAPAQLYRRQLALYPDGQTAEGVVDRFRQDLERCRTHEYDDGVSQDVWVDHGELSEGDDSFDVIAYAEQDGLRFTPATHVAVVRVGNAVLVSSYDGEFGAAPPDAIGRSLKPRLAEVRAIADRMCVFAVSGCSGGPSGGTGAAAENVPYVLAAGHLDEGTRLSGWALRDYLDQELLVCAEESTEALAGDRTDTRKFAVTEGEEVQALAITTVLDFDNVTTPVTDGYERAADWLTTCDEPLNRRHRIPSAGEALG